MGRPYAWRIVIILIGLALASGGAWLALRPEKPVGMACTSPLYALKLYPGATHERCMSAHGLLYYEGSGGSYAQDLLIYFTTDDPPAAVLTFYQQQLPRTGWKINQVTETTLYASHTPPDNPRAYHGTGTYRLYMNLRSAPGVGTEVQIDWRGGSMVFMPDKYAP